MTGRNQTLITSGTAGGPAAVPLGARVVTGETRDRSGAACHPGVTG
jgi:hypothetical protein